jgi:hypothetical protein
MRESTTTTLPRRLTRQLTHRETLTDVPRMLSTDLLSSQAAHSHRDRFNPPMRGKQGASRPHSPECERPSVNGSRKSDEFALWGRGPPGRSKPRKGS